MIDKHLNEVNGQLRIIARSERPSNGYLAYYWTICTCGNLKRYRYDQIRKNKACGMCEDFIASKVADKLKELGSGKE